VIAYSTALPIPGGISRFETLSDDDLKHEITDDDLVPDTQMWASRFAPACVKVDLNKHDLSSSNAYDVNSIIPFVMNVGDDETDSDEEIRKLFDVHKQSEATPDFWIAYQIGAFQPNLAEDGDPSGSWLLGYSAGATSFNSARSGSIVFTETIADYVTGNNQVTANLNTVCRAASLHEVGHLFALLHDTGGVMDENKLYKADTPELVLQLGFTGSGLYGITKARAPGMPGLTGR
jgi:hypothetical protein